MTITEKKDDLLSANRKDQLLIITGMSGAGKSQVVNSLEDMGYFCVDNLPPSLFSKFIAGMRLANDALPKMAIVVDVRAGHEAVREVNHKNYRQIEDGLAGAHRAEELAILKDEHSFGSQQAEHSCGSAKGGVGGQDEGQHVPSEP